jgi:hypothetical protein
MSSVSRPCTLPHLGNKQGGAHSWSPSYPKGGGETLTIRPPTLLLLAALAVVLCLGTFSSWPARGYEISTALTLACAPHPEQAANGKGYGRPIDENYLLTMPADEGEAWDELPAKAALLTMLVFGWLLTTSGWVRPRARACSLIMTQ